MSDRPDALLLVLAENAPADVLARHGLDGLGDALAAALADARTTRTAQTLAVGGDAPGSGATRPRRVIVAAVEPLGASPSAPPAPHPEDASPEPAAGPSSPVTAEAWRWAGARASAAARAVKAARVTLVLPPDAEAAAALVEGVRLGSYRYARYRTAPPDPDLAIAYDGPHDAEAVARAEVLADATALARDWVNRSPDEKLAPEMAELFATAAREAGVEAEVWDEARLADEGWGGLLGVARGSADPPRLVVLRYTPEGRSAERPVVLVGKTVVFDTGGLSLKPTADSMDKMKADMGGGAAVAAAVVAAARLKLDVPVVALLPITDNRPGGRAYVPGDVLRMLSGATVEVLNTDAEGRLILADALAHARSLAPRLVIDVATLTGAQGVSLGDRVAAVVARPADERLAAWVREHGETTGDLAWPMPLYSHYREMLTSDVADLKNVGGPMAGVLTAAAFLDHFTRDADGRPAYPWLHLDIARPSFLGSPYGYRPRGATGFGVRLLAALLDDVARGEAPLAGDVPRDVLGGAPGGDDGRGEA